MEISISVACCDQLKCLLFTFTGIVNDYHWYRLDNNGYWSHKPGRTPATDRDGNGDRIRDPRKAANGFIPYEFVCFMKINRFTLKIA